MGMTAHELGRDGLDDAAEIKQARLFRHAGVKDDLQQQVAEFLAQIFGCAALDRVGDFIGLFDRERSDRGEGLLDVPGAPASALTRTENLQRRRTVHSAGMARTVSLLLSAQHSADLQGVIEDRGRPVKHVQRAQIILLSAERLPVLEIAKRVGVSRPMVWRWQQRFAEEGIEGLLRDKTRPPGIPPVPQAKVHAVVERTLREPPGAVTHWTGRAMAKAMGLSLRTIQRIWAAHKLQPHRIRTFKRSNHPDFAAKLDDVVGLYINPPRHAAVVSIHEKSQIQALDRTQPGLPLKRGKCATLTHDYKRHGTTTLFAALSVLEGKVIGRCVPRHRHQEFIRFIATVERSVPAGKVIHAILDNYAAHKHPQVLAWLAEHPRWTFHFTPTSCSWLNAVEGFFSKLTRQSLKRGVFRSVDDLESAITRYIAATNRHPKPFVWTATAKTIQAKLRLNHPSESVH